MCTPVCVGVVSSGNVGEVPEAGDPHVYFRAINVRSCYKLRKAWVQAAAIQICMRRYMTTTSPILTLCTM